MAAASLPFAPATARAHTPADRPNIIFIMADDLGYADLGCYGARSIKTPQLDRLAAGGLQLFQGYANSAVCSATRTALITGRYQYRLRCGLEEPIGSVDVGLPGSEQTLPKYLRRLGYRTVLVGKWHLGTLPNFSPLKSGYDHFFGIQDGGADYFTHNLSNGSVVTAGLIEGGAPTSRHGYLTDLLGERAIAETERAVKAGVPLYLSLHFTAPHWPWEGPEDEAISKPYAKPEEADYGSLATYAAMVESMDANIGKLLDCLERLDIADNTIVVFTSDNGGERFSDVWPLTGAKTELLEGGIRVPLIVRWPKRIRPASKSRQVMISMDFVPTLLAAAGGKPASEDLLDGENLLPVLCGEAAEHDRKLYWRYKASEQAAVRDGDWKYLKMGSKEYLFNLGEDVRERANLKERHKERFAAMKVDFATWNQEMLPYPAESYSHSMTEFLPDR